MKFIEQVSCFLTEFAKICVVSICAWLLGYHGLSIAWVALLALTLSSVLNLVADQKRSITPPTSFNWSLVKNHNAWLSEVLVRLWPHTKLKVEEFMRTQLQQSVRKQLPSTLQTFTLTDIKLGSQVPKVLDVAVQDISSDCVTLDIEIIYFSDADIGFTIGRLHSSIRTVQVHGTLRVVLTDLHSSWPFFGNINISFLTQPAFSFLLSKSASIFNIVGFRDIIHESVVNQLNKIFVLPNFLTVPVNPSASLTPQYPIAEGVLRVIVHSAKGLVVEQKDYVDPYCTIQVGATCCRSGVLQKTTYPKWNEVFEFIVNDRERQYVQIECVDAADTTSSGSLGICYLSINSLIEANRVLSVPLEKTAGGCINVSVSWMELSSESYSLSQARPKLYGCKALSSAVLSLSVHSAKGLPKGLRSIRQPSPYVKLSVANDVKQTSVIQTSEEPTWREHFYFLIGDVTETDLRVEVIDELTDTLLGQTAIKLNHTQMNRDSTKQWFKLENYRGSTGSLCLGLRLKALCGDCLVTDSPSSDLSPSTSDTVDDPALTLRSVSVPTASTPAKVGLKRQTTEPILAKSETGSCSGQSDLLDFDNWSEMESNVIAGGSTYIVISRPDGSTVSEIVQNPPSTDETAKEITPEHTAVEDSLYGKMQVTLRYSLAQQKLMIVVHQCCNLSYQEKDGVPDPFVVLTFYNNRNKAERKKTKYQKATKNPVFDETFDFKILKAVFEDAVIEMRVKNRRGIFQKGKGDMGSVVLNLHALDLSEARTDWFLIRKLKGSTESLPNKLLNKSSNLNRTNSFVR